jgi:membrane protein insertase Oxa1/YidC/SpoIIIJ
MKKFSGNANQMAMDDNSEQAQMSLKIMDLVMPLMTLWLTFSFSAMMGLYWIYQSIFAIIQSIILGFAMPIPKYTEEEIKAMRKAQKAAEKAQKEIIKTQPKYKSLHYIDDDDYDELPTVNTNQTKPVSGAYENRPEIKD